MLFSLLYRIQYTAGYIAHGDEHAGAVGIVYAICSMKGLLTRGLEPGMKAYDIGVPLRSHGKDDADESKPWSASTFVTVPVRSPRTTRTTVLQGSSMRSGQSRMNRWACGRDDTIVMLKA
ncbi:MAG: hypothetical protein NT074_00075 [Methanomicrobiales archaeon]|nr:hypothetical protein [Methanomicrobiales archaeon]